VLLSCVLIQTLVNGPILNDLHRIIDANTNRASEGIRVLEDLARFSLESEELSRSLKELRHQLQTSIQQLGISQAALLESRDTNQDVGTAITTSNEQSRKEGLVDIASAAAKRAQEAIRVLEESSKALGYSGASFESIRYKLYDIHRDLVLKMERPYPRWSVCVLVTKSLCLHHTPRSVIQDAARAGAECIQIREKDMPSDEFLEHASAMVSCAHEHGMIAIINDRVDIALASKADGVHLGQQDLPISVARSILGGRAIIGRTCTNNEQLHEAFNQGADYCGLGPVFSSTTKQKPNLGGINLLESAMEDALLQKKPMLAISGIAPSNIDLIAATGFPGVAVSSAVCSASAPYTACRAIVEAMQHAASSSKC